MGHKRNIFIINPQYQFKFSLIICSLVLIGSIAYPLTIMDIFETFIQLNPDRADRLVTAKNNILQFVLFGQLSYLGITFVISIYLSHKVAGPLYKLKNYLLGIQEGKKVTELWFRKGDNFQDIAEEVTRTCQFLSGNQSSDEKKAQFLNYIDFVSVDFSDEEKEIINKIKTKVETI